jgi:uridine kinase
MPELVDMADVAARIKEVRRSKPGTVLVAIDGAGGAGKSTLAVSIARRVGNCYVICLDDFARPSVPGWDRDRFRRQVLDPLLGGRDAFYQRWDWPTDSGAEWHRVPSGSVVIIDGVSSTRTELGDCWDLTVWVEAPRSVRLARGVERDGEAMRSQWTEVWMAEEDAYIATQQPQQRADLIVHGYGPS